ncbi:MAG TPA: dodecin domain-containing protein [Thioalkalivibrio sp.]|nr:dodecin domain-containing protein [Thioalkalivibrio sp.]
MSVVKVIDVLAQSDKSWEDATAEALRVAAKSVKNIKSIYVQDFQGKVKNNEIVQFRVNTKISFVVNED